VLKGDPAGVPDGGGTQPAAASVVVINQAPAGKWNPGSPHGWGILYLA
jgi:hypothetical protein